MIAFGMLTVPRTHAQIVFVLPHALPPKTQMLHPETPAGGAAVNVTLTLGVEVWNGPGLPLKSTPGVALDQL